MSGEENELDTYVYRPADPPYWPGDEAGYEHYHRQMYGLSAATSGFARWKIISSGQNLARQIAGARNRGLSVWVAEHGADPARWPLPHPPAVVWAAGKAAAVCLGCWWLDDSPWEPAGAAALARLHAAAHREGSGPMPKLLLEPLPVWTHADDGDGQTPWVTG